MNSAIYRSFGLEISYKKCGDREFGPDFLKCPEFIGVFSCSGPDFVVEVRTHTHTHTCIRRQSGRYDFSQGNRGDSYTLS